jgi:aryl-phospho-beta-D-glucosidase BglC (GH1 family)
MGHAFAGFYINVDFHSNKWGGVGDQSVFNKAQWIANWAALLRNILTQAPEANGRLLIDLMNEPDGCEIASIIHFCVRGSTVMPMLQCCVT